MSLLKFLNWPEHFTSVLMMTEQTAPITFMKVTRFSRTDLRTKKTSPMKKVLVILAVTGVLAGAYFLIRIFPVLTTDNTGAEKVVLLHGFGR